jgi:hypothetical protein
MALSNCIEHYFLGCCLCLRIGSAFCGRWLNWPILCDHGAALCNCRVQTTKGADVDKTLHIVPKHTIHNIFRAADGTPFMIMRAAFHRRSHVIDNFCVRDGSVNGGGIS